MADSMEVDERSDDRQDSMAAESPPVNDGMEEDMSEHARPRKRTRRACDKCSASRTRCNGECPCRRCEDYGYTCRYNREVKKRGRVPISMTGGVGSAGSVQSEPSPLQAGRHTSPKDSQPNTFNQHYNPINPNNNHAQHENNRATHQSHRASFGNGHSGGDSGTTPSPSVASPSGGFPGGVPSASISKTGMTGTGGGDWKPQFNPPQRTHSFSDALSAARPHLHSSHSTHSNYSGSHRDGGQGRGLGMSVGDYGVTPGGPNAALPGISTVSGLAPAPGPRVSSPLSSSQLHQQQHPHHQHLPPYLHSPGGGYGGGSGAHAHTHMQLASLLDSTAVADHPLSTHHQQQVAAAPRTALLQGGTPPGGGGGSGGVGGGGRVSSLSGDESIGYPSPAGGGGSANSGDGATGGVTSGYSARQPRGSFSGGAPAGGIRPRTHDNPNNNNNNNTSGVGSGGGVRRSNNNNNRGSFSTTTTTTTTTTGGGQGELGSLPELQRVSSLYRAPSANCRYQCLVPVLPYLGDIVPASVACDLLDVYLTEPGSSLFRCASPYILTRIFRKRSLLHPSSPRPTTPALLATMLWCAAQTADIVLLHVPGSRSKITNALYELSTSLITERDPDRWRRIHGGLRVEADPQQPHRYPYMTNSQPTTTATNEPAGVIDDVLTFILLSIAVSGGDFKSDCFKWWSKAIRLALALGLNREDERCSASVSPCANPLCSCRRDQDGSTLADAESREERRRVFWLLYCLDRHLALSFNSVLYIPDSYCEVYAPLPEAVWEDLDAVPAKDMPDRVLGPPTVVSGTGFFEYFLPLMAILGDIIEVHHRRQHPRLGGLDDTPAVALIGEQLAACERSLDRLAREVEMNGNTNSGAGAGDYGGGAGGATQPVPAPSTPGMRVKDLVTGGVPPPPPPPPLQPQSANGGGPGAIADGAGMMTTTPGGGGGGAGSGGTATATGAHSNNNTGGLSPPSENTPGDGPLSAPMTNSNPPRRYRPCARDRSRLQLVTAYSTHILHVLHVLLHGKWDAISMLDDDDDWITSARFNDCATRAIAASQAVSRILKHDPELTFMPYLFGIYLLHGSFILLLFADRMPQLGGPNQSVEQACETIVRAHEVCVVTLSTEFQKNFRKVLRSTLYSVRGSSPTEWEEHKARRRALSLYRWTRGAKGLAL